MGKRRKLDLHITRFFYSGSLLVPAVFVASLATSLVKTHSVYANEPLPVEEESVARDLAKQSAEKSKATDNSNQSTIPAGEQKSKEADTALSEDAPVQAPVEPVVQAAKPVPRVVANRIQPRLFLDEPIQSGKIDRRSWAIGGALSSLSIPTPIFTVSGDPEGPALCLTAAVHGDELNGVEIIRRVIYGLDPTQLRGTIIAVPVVNVHGFQRASRYLPDRRDLNRYFPGDPKGSSAARIGHAFFSEVISHCTWLVDIHTGSFHRTNLPQLRANLLDDSVRKLTELFGQSVVLHSEGAEGTLRRAATDAGIPAFTIETGEPLRFQPEEVAEGVKGIQSLMRGLGLMDGKPNSSRDQSVFYRSMWLRADQGGILFSQAKLGDKVTPGQVLGSVTDPISNAGSFIHSPVKGRIVGMAVNQMVMPGFAAYHVGVTEEAPIDAFIESSSDSDGDFEVAPK